MRQQLTWLLVLSLAAPLTAHAQEAKRVDPVVVTATPVATPAEQLGASVSVVDGQDFQTYHYPTVDEALRSVPGVEIRRSGAYGKTSSVTIRGANANQVQVLVDGLRVKSPTLGQVDLSDLSPDLIERIEVIRGAQSTIYGADAIGGVVNIITRRGTGGPIQASVQQEVGNYDTLVSRATVHGAWKILHYALSASHFESNGQFQNDETDANAVSARVGATLPWDSTLDFIVRYNKNDIGVPVKGVFPGPQPIHPIINRNARSQSETTIFSLDGKTRPVPWWETRGRLARYENSAGFQDPVDPGVAFDSPVFSQVNVERREAEWVNSFFIGKWSTSSVGLEHRREIGESRNTFRAVSETESVFFEQQLRFFERLFLTGGFRMEDNSVWGTTTTERGSLAFLIKETGTRLRGSAGTGFRAPTFNDLFFPGFGNPVLQPEESLSYDFGVDQKLWNNRIRLGLTYFQNEFKNLITCCTPIPTAPFGGPFNVGRARSAGIEFTSEVDVLPNLVASLNYTYTDSENLATDRLLPREPRHRWNIGLTWEPIMRLSLFTQVHVASEQLEAFGEVYNSGHTRVDVGGTWRILERMGLLKKLELTARIQNLLNEGYAEVRGFPALGINALVGVRVSF
ncbi:MAG TPA: TonB-dependent receptor [Candidatus Deferrimicrobiaceae bacterium]|nr:TonB-dependent receptor [Candidatus Deferrimicrobiaceae bacterium]